MHWLQPFLSKLLSSVCLHHPAARMQHANTWLSEHKIASEGHDWA